MRAAFLRSRALALCPVEAVDDGPALAAPWRLLSPGGSGESIALTAVDPSDAFLGLVKLEQVDWLRREAVVTLRWSGPTAGSGEALRLVVAYAFDELNLERLEARAHPADKDARALLEGQGFAPARGRGSVDAFERLRP